MKLLTLFCLSILVLPSLAGKENTMDRKKDTNSRPTISFTFDDGSTTDMPGYPFETWNAMMLGHLKEHGLKAILFSTGSNKLDEKGRHLLTSWNDAGHRIANHTMTHPNFSNAKTTVEQFKWELLAMDSIARNYSNYMPYFRFPYLKEGNTEEKVQAFRLFMKQQGYRNGYVSVDASDWYIDSRLVQRLRQDPDADIEGFKKYYLDHMLERAEYYENLSHTLTGRHIDHVLLLHHNLAAALFLGDLIQHFKDNGWDVIDADRAYDDEIYNTTTHVIPAGESLIWSMAKESGRFEDRLRYPAEDSRYEKDRMDSLGL